MARSDLSKLLCERPRPLSRNKFRDVRHSKHIEEFEGKILTPGVAFGYNKKQFNENLNPLRRFLKSSVGRRWDDIYSELCSVLDRRKTIDEHVFSHLMEDVETKTDLRDGKVVYMNEHDYYGHAKERGWTEIEKCHKDLYVHPVTNILTKVHKSQRKAFWRERNKLDAEEKAKTQRVIEGKNYEKLKGCWFEWWFEKKNFHTNPKEEPLIVDIRQQRQLSGKELKKLGLKND